MYLFLNNIGAVLRKACDHDGDTLHLARAAQVVCREMLERKLSFHGSFKEGCQRDAVSQTHLIMMNMIPEGPNIKCQTQVTSSVKLRLHQVSNSGYIKCQTQVTSSVKLRLHQVSNSGYIKCQTQVTSSVKLRLHQVSNSGYIKCQTQVTSSVKLRLHQVSNSGYIKCQIQVTSSKKPSLSISQLLMFNSVKYARAADSSGAVCHNCDQEAPLPTLHCNDGVTYKSTYWHTLQFWDVWFL